MKIDLCITYLNRDGLETWDAVASLDSLGVVPSKDFILLVLRTMWKLEALCRRDIDIIIQPEGRKIAPWQLEEMI